MSNKNSNRFVNFFQKYKSYFTPSCYFTIYVSAATYASLTQIINQYDTKLDHINTPLIVVCVFSLLQLISNQQNNLGSSLSNLDMVSPLDCNSSKKIQTLIVDILFSIHRKYFFIVDIQN